MKETRWEIKTDSSESDMKISVTIDMWGDNIRYDQVKDNIIGMADRMHELMLRDIVYRAEEEVCNKEGMGYDEFRI